MEQNRVVLSRTVPLLPQPPYRTRHFPSYQQKPISHLNKHCGLRLGTVGDGEVVYKMKELNFSYDSGALVQMVSEACAVVEIQRVAEQE